MLRTRHIVILVSGCLLSCLLGLGGYRYRIEQQQRCDPATLPLGEVHDGDLIFSEGHSLKSDLVRMAARSYHSDYSHVGFLRHRGAELRVVHMSIDDGCLLEESLEEFIRKNRVRSIGIGRLCREPAPERLNRTLDSLLLTGKAFDFDFDLQDDGAYYCTELIVKALSAAGAPLRTLATQEGILYPPALLNPETSSLINP